MEQVVSVNPHAGRTATLVGLVLATSAEAWTTSGVSLTLTDLTGTLSSSSDEASWALTVYTTAFAIGVALSHRLSLNFGNRRYLTTCGLLYGIASCGCAFSPDLQFFLLFRVIAGFAGGSFLVRSLVFFTQQYPVAERGKPLVMYVVGYFTLGKFIAPVVCGWFADVISWRLIFSASTVLALAAAVLFARFSEDHWLGGEREGRFDYIGAFLLITGAACLQVVFSRGEVEGWLESGLLTAFLVSGLVGNLAFVLWQLSEKNQDPLIELASIRSRSSFAGAVFGFCVGILLAGSLYVVPQYLRSIETHSALQTGLLLSVGGGVSVVVVSCFTGISALIVRIGGGGVIALALIIEIASQLLFAHYLTPDTPDKFLWLPLALNGAFIALSVPTLGIVAFSRIKDSQTSNARALYYGFRQFGASVGVTCAAVLIDRRMTLHSSRLLEAFAARDPSILGMSSSSMTPQAIAGMVHRQSAVLSYADVFYAMTIVAFITLLFLPLLPPAASAPIPDSTELRRGLDLGRSQTIGVIR
jgi:EmrB/QacA subfamily drug resistance transporter